MFIKASEQEILARLLLFIGDLVFKKSECDQSSRLSGIGEPSLRLAGVLGGVRSVRKEGKKLGEQTVHLGMTLHAEDMI